MADLGDVRLRLAHAEEKRRELAGSVDSFLESKPYDTAVEFDRGEGVRRFVFRVKSDPPKALGLLLADTLNAARTSLDHVVYELALRSGADPDAKGVSTQFPISEDRKKYAQGRDRLMAGLSDPYKRLIDSVQPYHRGPVMGKRDPLAQLNWMSNRDKHRAPLARFVQLQPHAVPIWRFNAMAPADPHDEIPTQHARPLSDGDVLAIVRNPTDADVYLTPQANVAVAFGKPELTCDRLGFIISYIERQIVARAEKL